MNTQGDKKAGHHSHNAMIMNTENQAEQVNAINVWIDIKMW